MTTAVPAFQVLTIGSLGDTNLDASIRSFARHITGIPNENVQDKDKEEKKRKREIARKTSTASMVPSPIGITGDESPSKKLRNGEDEIDETRKVLPKSIASLYESIQSAQRELEASRSWEADVLDEM